MIYLIITKCITVVWKRFDNSIVKYFQFHVILSLIIMSAYDIILEIEVFFLAPYAQIIIFHFQTIYLLGIYLFYEEY